MTGLTPSLDARSAIADFLPKASSRPGLWSLAQFGRATTLWLAAFVMLAVATLGSRGDANPANSGIWILLGLLGGLLAGSGTTFWLVAGTRSVRQRQQVFATRLAALSPDLELVLGVREVASALEQTVVDLAGAATLVRLEQGTLYHRADCLLVAGKSQVRVDVVHPDLTACGVCSP